MSDESSPDSEHASPFGPDPEPAGPEPTGGPRRAQPGRVRHGIRWGRIVIITIAVLFATVAGAVGYFGFKLNQSVTSISRDSSLLPTGSRPASASNTANTTYTAMNILLIGSDSRGSDQGRSDTFIILHISADRKSVYLVSFPRDMWVTIPGYGKAKINAGYSYGGSALAVSTIENLTGARIDHVVVTDFTDFIQLVDTVGPITVDNPVGSVVVDDRGVKYNFPKGPLVITEQEQVDNRERAPELAVPLQDQPGMPHPRHRPQTQHHLLVDIEHRHQQQQRPQHAGSVVLPSLGIGAERPGVVVPDHHDQTRADDRQQRLQPHRCPIARGHITLSDRAERTLDITGVGTVQHRAGPRRVLGHQHAPSA